MAKMISKRRKTTGVTKKSKKKRVDLDLAWKEGNEEEVSSASEDEHEGRAFMHVNDHDEEEETVDAKRVRMARAYLDKLEQQQQEESEDEEEDEQDRISSTLQRQRLMKRGTYQRDLAALVEADVAHFNSSCETSKDWMEAGHMHALKGHDLTPTCVAMSHSQPHLAVSGSKDHSVILWNVEKNERVSFLQQRYQKHSDEDRNGGEVLSIATSQNGNLVAVGKRNATIALYDVRKKTTVTEFAGHKGPITALAFQSNEALFSGSTDRCIRHYNIQELAYVETLYGHQAEVTGLDCLREERPVSVGRDRTARIWKLAEDSHLIFRGGGGLYSGESISYLNNNYFVTGHEQTATLCLWNANKKKAVAEVVNAHQHSSNPSQYCSITSLAACKQSDLVVSGSNDGYLRLWKTTTDAKPCTMEPIGKIPLKGFCNGIAVAPNANHVLVAVGQEPRLGRWERVPKAKNRIHVVQLRRKDKNGDNDDEAIAEEKEHLSEEEESDSDDSAE